MESQYDNATTQPEASDVLYDLFPENQLEDASMGQRLANYLIDVVGYYILCLILGVLLGVLHAGGVMNAESTVPEEGFGTILISVVIYLLYMTLSEGLGRGKSLGKLITGTRAVKEDGSTITFKDAFLRTLSRLVPFEALSIFFGHRPWHDQWTNTVVIKKQRQ